MATKYRLVIDGDTADAIALQAAVSTFVAELELVNTATAELVLEEPAPPPQPIDIAHEPLTYQIDVTGRVTPVIVSARNGEYVGIGATIDEAKADLVVAASLVAVDAVVPADEVAAGRKVIP